MVHIDLLLTLSITFGTTSFHLFMRLAIGYIFNRKMKNHADYTKKWYQLHSWEKELYRIMRVKKWNTSRMTYDPKAFSPKLHTWMEIAQVMCQSELVHESNIVLSFLPIISSIWLGAAPVFFITSVCASLFDLMFVIIQRYNRARILAFLKKRS
jgi:magnesium-transporting ATPase (P-type)